MVRGGETHRGSLRDRGVRSAHLGPAAANPAGPFLDGDRGANAAHSWYRHGADESASFFVRLTVSPGTRAWAAQNATTRSALDAHLGIRQISDVQQRLVAIGDSITLGHWDPRGEWLARLRQVGDEEVVDSKREKYSAVYNLGISSNTSADVRSRYEEEVSARFPIGTDAHKYVALAVGINDSQLRGGKRLVTPGQYRENMEALV